MKLLTKTGLYYLLLSLLIFGGGGIYFFYSLNDMLNEDITDNAYLMKHEIKHYVEKNGALPPESPIGYFRIHYDEVTEAIEESLIDTLLPDEDQELEACRSLIFPIHLNGKHYQATVNVQLVEKDELTEEIIYSLGLLAGILLVLLFIGNWFLSRNLWKPFYKTLDRLKNFSPSATVAPEFKVESTYEFNQLNDELKEMTNKIIRDFQNLKSFTENAAHELQTPLAIIRSKLETLIQTEGLPEAQIKLIAEVYETTGKLNKLNQSLLLLAKIENRQFREENVIDLAALIKTKVQQLQELADLKNISVSLDLSEVKKKISPELAEILLSNLLGNAIRHNIENGSIKIELNKDRLNIQNSGKAPEVPTGELLQRFKKSSTSIESTGLGLAIVKQICDTYDYELSYHYSNELHTLSVIF